MLESIDQFKNSASQELKNTVQPQNLSRFRYHTGATPTPLHAGEPCPPLFRDLGLLASAQFLAGGLSRLSGPLSPITYLRSLEFQEPYQEHAHVGRILLLRPLAVHPWRSGVPHVFISPHVPLSFGGTLGEVAQTLVYIPAYMPLRDVAEAFPHLRSRQEAVDLLGGSIYKDFLIEERARLKNLVAAQDACEVIAAPVRAALKHPRTRLQTRDLLEQHGISEQVLCAAWNHIPKPSRDALPSQLEALLNAPQWLHSCKNPTC